MKRLLSTAAPAKRSLGRKLLIGAALVGTTAAGATCLLSCESASVAVQIAPQRSSAFNHRTGYMLVQEAFYAYKVSDEKPAAAAADPGETEQPAGAPKPKLVVLGRSAATRGQLLIQFN